MLLQLLSSYFLPFSLLLLFLFLCYSSFVNEKASKNQPPSPPRLPIIGNLHQIGYYRYRSLQSLSRKYGPLMLLRFGSVPVLVVSSAEAAREVMKTQDLSFASRPKLSIHRKLLYDTKDVLFAPYGEYWRQVRSICVVHLLSKKRVESFQYVREEETAVLIQKIRKSCSSSSSVVNLTELFMSLTNNVVCRIALGSKYSGEEGGGKINELLARIVELMGMNHVGDSIPWLGWINWVNGLDARVDKVAKEMDKFLEGVVQERIERNKRENHDCGEEGQDFLDILLEIQRDNIAGAPVHRDTVKALILDMFGAGIDTTFSALEWTMAEIVKHPDVMKKLQNEAREVAKAKPDITESDLDKLHYLKAVIKESLRIHCPVPLLAPRESIQDANVMGYHIKAGTQVIINAWAIARDPSYWEDPEEFRPERFMNPNSLDFRGQNFEYIPFGSGRRGCAGISFAMHINELVLAKLVNEFDFSLPGGAGGESMDMSEAIGITIKKKIPLVVVATPRFF
ncbi:cytochrome P450 736A117-like [Diospyros lotus]|uniref:cytochrome P450 736A117-like n=1 Tax=Diospyros lotus TaxID=55363 RepID=UPI0022538634|nr:cytochrome P450 736A117-like [Diospyros lotus]